LSKFESSELTGEREVSIGERYLVLFEGRKHLKMSLTEGTLPVALAEDNTTIQLLAAFTQGSSMNRSNNQPWLFARPSPDTVQLVKQRAAQVYEDLRRVRLQDSSARHILQKELNRLWTWLGIAGVHLQGSQELSKVNSKFVVDSPFHLHTHFHLPVLEDAESGAHYHFTKIIHENSGAGRVVYDAIESLSSKRFVVKVVSKRKACDRERMKALRHEFMIHGLLSEFSHPHVSSLEKYFENQSRIYAISCRDDLSLFDLLRALDVKDHHKLSMMRQMTSAVCFLSNLGLAHRDLKPSNFVVSQTLQHGFVVKLIDFGSTTVLSYDPLSPSGWAPLSGVAGTTFAMAPEVFNYLSTKAGYDAIKADVYSLGLTFFALLARQQPYHSPSMLDNGYRFLFRYGAAKLLGKITNGEGAIYQLASTLVDQMMAVDTSHRCSLFHVAATLCQST